MTLSIKKYLPKSFLDQLDFICIYNNITSEALSLIKKYYDKTEEVNLISYPTYKSNNRYF